MKLENFSNIEAQKTPVCCSVTEVTKMIQNCLESQFSEIEVEGEISNFIAHASGHWYFTLKDSHSQIRGVMFRGVNQKIGWKPKRGEGIKVRVRGAVSVYGARGEYQIICKSMEKSGKGRLHEEFEKLKKKLKEEGLFERKKELPFLPQHLAIISSPTGAAIRDILNILKRRYRGVQVTLIPALVQGKGAPESLLQALEKLQALKDVDVLILTRGGGSLEDLWAFNDEALARALFHCPLPVISAVGHEIDFTICDFVADLRAPTPSAAGELVVQNAEDLTNRIRSLHTRLSQNMKRELIYLRQHLKSFNQTLQSPRRKVQEFQQYVDDLNARLKKSFNQQHYLKKEQLKGLSAVLESLSPLKVLDRGYSIVTKGKELVKTAQTLKKDDEIHIQFAKSFTLANITKTGLEPKK